MWESDLTTIDPTQRIGSSIYDSIYAQTTDPTQRIGSSIYDQTTDPTQRIGSSIYDQTIDPTQRIGSSIYDQTIDPTQRIGSSIYDQTSYDNIYRQQLQEEIQAVIPTQHEYSEDPSLRIFAIICAPIVPFIGFLLALVFWLCHHCRRR